MSDSFNRRQVGLGASPDGYGGRRVRAPLRAPLPSTERAGASCPARATGPST
jgi:hypothetical protein